jgi:predicted transcriptional regulator
MAQQSSLGDRELDVMAVLWKHGSGTVTEVQEHLPADLAYTTVLTILRNLQSKGFVRHESLGKAHRYFPLVAKQTARKSAIRQILKRLFHGSPEELVAHLVREREITEEQLRKVGKLVAKETRARRKPK